MNPLVGNNDITADKDPKHVMKRCRNFTIRKSGVMINSFVVTPALLRFHLQANKVPAHRIMYLLNPTDRQDVPLCYTFMKEVWSLPPPAPTDKPSFVAARDALLILGSLFRHLALPYVQVSLSFVTNPDTFTFFSTSFHHIPLRAAPMTHTAYEPITDP